MKITSSIICILTVFAIATGCSAPKDIVYNNEKLSPSGYSQYKTYAFQPTKDTSYTKMFDKKRLESLMSAMTIRELSKKGMQLDTTKPPDCFFTYKLIVNRDYAANQQEELVYNPDVYIPAFDNDARIYTFSSNNRPVTYAGQLHIDTLREASLVIDMIDRQQGNVVWRSTMQGKVKETFQQPTEARIYEIISTMFKKFPKK